VRLPAGDLSYHVGRCGRRHVGAVVFFLTITVSPGPVYGHMLSFMPPPCWHLLRRDFLRGRFSARSCWFVGLQLQLNLRPPCATDGAHCRGEESARILRYVLQVQQAYGSGSGVVSMSGYREFQVPLLAQ
jgi:hypothetical protein